MNRNASLWANRLEPCRIEQVTEAYRLTTNPDARPPCRDRANRVLEQDLDASRVQRLAQLRQDGFGVHHRGVGRQKGPPAMGPCFWLDGGQRSFVNQLRSCAVALRPLE